MSTATRATMRLLSPRIQCLQRPARCAQIRHASSRYSEPSKRTFVAAPVQSPVFAAQVAQTSENVSEIRAPFPSPLGAREAAIAHEEKRQYHLRRMRFAGMGLLLSIFGLAALLYNLDLDDMEQAQQSRRGHQLDAVDDANRQFRGKEVEIIGTGEDKRIVARGTGEEVDLVETGTSSVPLFPRTIYLPTSPESTLQSGFGARPNTVVNPGNVENQEQYTLLGLGIRSVSFLSIQVYVVGLYIRTQDISGLQEKLVHHINPTASTLVPSEKEELSKRLLDPTSSKEIWSEILKVPGLKTAWRVSPTRSTDFGHLRDGWVTGITKRMREAKQIAQNQATEYDAEDFGVAINNFKSILASGKAPKGSIMILSRDRSGSLDIWYEPKPGGKGDEGMQKLGSVADERVSRLIWLGYLGGDKVSSEAARQGIAQGCVDFAGRPIGSAESRVV